MSSYEDKVLLEYELEYEQKFAADYNLSPPTPTEPMLYGFVGEVGRDAAETTEANPYAVAMDTLIMLSGEFGRDVFLSVGNTFHHPRLFALHVGRSGRGRKGDALSLPMRIRNKARALNENLNSDLFGQTHTGGLSSREGLVTLIHDGFSAGKTETPAIDDKRIFVVESEFSNVLHQTKRDGNTLSAALRDAWDGQSIRPLTKSNQIGATDPHIALLGHVTPSELVELMKSRELSNGFANRFLIFWGERNRTIPFPEPTSDDRVTAFAHRFAGIVKFAKGNYPAAANSRQAALTDDAKALYARHYAELCKPLDGGRIDGILERRAPILLRLALCFALTDKTLAIDVQHINAAKAWIDYVTKSVRYIFESGEKEAEAAEVAETAYKIYAAIKVRGEMTKTEISSEVFDRHKTANEIDAALQFLLSESPPEIEIETRKGKGRPVKFYKLAAKKAKKANYLENQIDTSENSARIKCEKSEISHDDADLFSHNSHNSQTEKTATDRATRLFSLNSLNSHTPNEVEL